MNTESSPEEVVNHIRANINNPMVCEIACDTLNEMTRDGKKTV